MAKTLTIFLAADVSKLNRGLNQARGDMTGLSGTINNLLGPALIGAGIAAAGFAVALGVDGVKAAIEDDAALQKLAQTLDNVGLAHDTAQIEEYIGALESSLGIADDQLRPAYDRLVRSIKDTEGANKALALALDISAGSGKSLDAVVQALGRAYDGNVSGLSRLGAGIDQAILKTGDMDAITASLAATFAGQATTSAQTFEGQTRRLSVAGDNLKEAFGAGLLKSLGDTNARTQDLVDTFEDWEPVLEGIGGAVGTFATTTLDGLNKNLAVTDDNAAAAKDSLDGLNVAARVGGGFIAELGGAFGGANSPIGVFLRLLGMVDDTAAAVPKALSATVQAAIDAGNAMKGAALATASFSDALAEVSDKPSKAFYTVLAQLNKGAVESNYSLDRFDKTIKTTGASASSAATGMATLNTETEIGAEKFAATETVLKSLNNQLQQQTTDLQNATTAITSYAQSVADQITRGFDLSAGLTITDGQANAAEWLSGVDAEVAKYQWFGNVLAEIQRQGGPELRDYFASLGADVGGEMGQAAITGGLVPQLANKLLEVQTAAYNVGQAMVPEFLLAGEDSALQFVNGTVSQIAKEEKRLRKIGENIGKPIGANIKKEIAEAVAEAIKAAEASRTAALAEISAREAATTAGAVEQATAQSLARLIRNSDNRAGRNVQPVLA